jgi:5-(carboxyamino)imidazole ribonucleotide synthase
MTAVLPGGTIGVLGSGQLGRMLALAARRLGYRVHVFSPEQNSPAGQVANLEVAAPYGDLTAVRQFAAGSNVEINSSI